MTPKHEQRLAMLRSLGFRLVEPGDWMVHEENTALTVGIAGDELCWQLCNKPLKTDPQHETSIRDMLRGLLAVQSPTPERNRP